MYSYVTDADNKFLGVLSESQNEMNMCTVTLSYDQNNALARRKLAALLATGLFVRLADEMQPSVTDSKEEERKEVEAFLDASKHNMSHIIARYL